MDDIDGVWRTVGGRRIFIKDGQDLATAMRESGKFSNKETEKKETNAVENKRIRKAKEITKEELEKIYNLSQTLNEEGFKIGIEKAVFDIYGQNKNLPRVLSQENFKNMQGKEIYKGIGANSIEEKKNYYNQLTNGDIYVGNNNSGSGVWFTENKGVASGYQDGSNGTTSKNSCQSFMVYGKISKKARIIKAEELPSKKDRIIYAGIENEARLQKIVYDDGLYASMLGYDILETKVNFGKVSNYAILNRNMIGVKEND